MLKVLLLKTNYLMTLFLIASFGYSQESKKTFISNNSSSEMVRDFKGDYEMIINDSRSFPKYKINTETLFTNLNGYNELFQNNTSIEISGLKNKKIIVNLDFFNFSSASNKNIIIKGIVDVEINGGDYSDTKEKFSFSDELFTSIKFKKISNAKFTDDINKEVDIFSKEFAKKIVDKIKEITNTEETHIFEAISIGCVNFDIKKGKQEAQTKAELTALLKASESAFGSVISNTTQIQDFGDVSDLLKSEAGAIVLYQEILDGSLKFTDDNYCCLLLKSILKKQ